MRIGIDISQIIYGTGVSVYVKNLVENLLKVDSENEYILFGGSLRRLQDLKDSTKNFQGNFANKFFNLPPTVLDFVWNRLHVLPIERLIDKVDVFHTSDWTEPPSNYPKVTTVHDLYPLKFPKLVSPVIRTTHKRKLSWAFRESKIIIVPSQSTRQDLIDLGMDDRRIRVIPEAPTLEKATPLAVENAKQKFGIKGDYLISVGITKLKNTLNIIKAFELAKSGQDIKLVLVGTPRDVDLSGLRNVRALGHVSSNDLASLLTGSKGLVFASLYEGYGLPILDAFACETPVVTSNISSMPEVAGNAAILVDPYDVNSIADGIGRALRGPKGLIEKGIERVKQFSWEETARKTLAVYNEAR